MLPGESLDAYYDRMQSQMADYIIHHPVEVAHLFASHFFHNEIEMVTYLPMSFKFYSLQMYVKQVGFWSKPLDDPTVGFGVLLFINLGLMALGLGAAINRTGFVGLIPVLIQIGYSLSVVPTGQSGWRFILPVDWVSLVYYIIGLVYLGGIIISVLKKEYVIPNPDNANAGDTNSASAKKAPQKKIFQVLVFSLILGLSFPAIEWLIPVRYPAKTPEEIIQIYAPENLQLANDEVISPAEINSFLVTNKNAVVLYGRALYPAYYGQGEFWGEENRYITLVKDYDRLQFSLMGSKSTAVFIPLLNPPSYFPHGSDVVVIGCGTESYVKALVIRVNGQDPALVTSPWNGLKCDQ
jgi:hypothetical protein